MGGIAGCESGSPAARSGTSSRGSASHGLSSTGLGNMDEFRTDYKGGLVGLSLRFFDPKTRLWSIYWTDTRRSGLLEPPVVGSFSDGVGVFECDDTFDGRPIIVRYVWSDMTATTARWAQSFSADGGETWETNWTVEHRRV